MPDRDPSPADLRDMVLLTEAVREGGEIARKFFGGNYKSWDKSHGNPVTEADIAIDRRLREMLLAARPGYGWLSEETEDDLSRFSHDRVFVVDPIDGTVGFLKGRPHFTVVAAVVCGGRPRAAAVYNPIADEMYDAAHLGGARCNGRSIQTAARDTLEGARILAPRQTFADKSWHDTWPASIELENRSSIAYRLALVAEGRFDAMISLSVKHDWDLAAGDLLLHEAGGLVTTPDGTTLVYNKRQPLQYGVIGAGLSLHALVLERVKLICA